MPQSIPMSQPRASAPVSRPAYDASPAASVRRPQQAHDARVQAAAAPAQRPVLRDRPLPQPQQDAFAMDHDWDVPAFQRKQR